MGWSTSSTGSTEYQPGAAYSGNSNLTLYAVWKQDEVQTYTVSYNANEGTNAPSAQTKYHGQNLTLSNTSPTRDGYSFLGWSTSSGGSVEYHPGDTYSENRALTLYAVWQKSNSPSFIFVSFDANGGTVSLSTPNFVALTGRAYGDLPTPTRDGYTFDGWYTSLTGGTKVTASTTVPYSGGEHLYAHWTKQESSNPVDSNAPQIAIENQSVSPGSTFTVPIRLKNNPGISSFELQVDYDANVLELVDKAEGDFSGVTFGDTLKVKPYPMVWSGGTQDNTGSVAGTLTFKVKDNTAKSTRIQISYGEEPPYNTSDKQVSFELVSGTITIESVMHGDANGDGRVTARDATRITQYVAKWDVEIVKAAADVNGDGKITARDATRILQYVAKWDVTLQGETAELQSLAEPSIVSLLAPEGQKIVIEDKTVNPSDEFDVSVKLESNPGISSFELLVEYDADKLELVDKAEGDFSGVTFGNALDVRPYPMVWSGGTQNNTGSIAGTLKFKVKDGASGTTQINISYGEEPPYNTSDQEVQFELINGTVTIKSDEPPVTKRTVIWLNGDGTELERKDYNEGEAEPTTDKTPTKAEDANYIYTFSGWDSGTTEGTVKTYTPNFNREEKQKTVYTVIWLNGDGTELERKDYNEGEAEPTTDKTPTKAEDANYIYTFSGWDSGITEGTVKTYTPNFNREEKQKTVYTVIWLNADGTELDRKEYDEGEAEPTTNKTPTKAEDANYTYAFSGWDSGTIAGTVKTYTPNFDREEKQKTEGQKIVIEDKTVNLGDEFDVSVKFENNPGISSFELLVDYDADKLELVDKAEGDFSGVTFGNALDVRPYPMVWSGGTQNNTGSVAGTLKFKVKNDASETTRINISYGEEPPYNTSEQEVQFELINGTVTIKSDEPPITEYTVIWLNGDGSELDRKTYQQGQSEPATDKTPTKAEDANYTYTFFGWDSGTTSGTVKTYTPNFNREEKQQAPYTVIWLNVMSLTLGERCGIL